MNRIEPTFGGDSINLDTTQSARPKAAIFNENENELRLRFPLASIWQRDIAQTIDFIISFAIFSLCLLVTKEVQIDPLYADVFIVTLPCLYFVFSDGFSNGQSLGKRLFNISVINKNTGEYCSFYRSFLRNFFTPVTGIIDVIIMVFKRRRRLGDLFASTVAVKNS